MFIGSKTMLANKQMRTGKMNMANILSNIHCLNLTFICFSVVLLHHGDASLGVWHDLSLEPFFKL